jgi:hypothetical protein
MSVAICPLVTSRSGRNVPSGWPDATPQAVSRPMAPSWTLPSSSGKTPEPGSGTVRPATSPMRIRNDAIWPRVTARDGS